MRVRTVRVGWNTNGPSQSASCRTSARAQSGACVALSGPGPGPGPWPGPWPSPGTSPGPSPDCSAGGAYGPSRGPGCGAGCGWVRKGCPAVGSAAARAAATRRLCSMAVLRPWQMMHSAHRFHRSDVPPWYCGRLWSMWNPPRNKLPHSAHRYRCSSAIMARMCPSTRRAACPLPCPCPCP
jgi:hypothetical protein